MGGYIFALTRCVHTHAHTHTTPNTQHTRTHTHTHTHTPPHTHSLTHAARLSGQCLRSSLGTTELTELTAGFASSKVRLLPGVHAWGLGAWRPSPGKAGCPTQVCSYAFTLLFPPIAVQAIAVQVVAVQAIAVQAIAVQAIQAIALQAIAVQAATGA